MRQKHSCVSTGSQANQNTAYGSYMDNQNQAKTLPRLHQESSESKSFNISHLDSQSYTKTHTVTSSPEVERIKTCIMAHIWKAGLIPKHRCISTRSRGNQNLHMAHIWTRSTLLKHSHISTRSQGNPKVLICLTSGQPELHQNTVTSSPEVKRIKTCFMAHICTVCPDQYQNTAASLPGVG